MGSSWTHVNRGRRQARYVKQQVSFRMMCDVVGRFNGEMSRDGHVGFHTQGVSNPSDPKVTDVADLLDA